jgi:haloalkane dehalogenase
MKPLSVLLAAASFMTVASAQAVASNTNELPSTAAPAISETLSIERKKVEVLGSQMAYLEKGTGAPVVFVHGNPTSSYLWRNVMPLISTNSRTIAVDLIGMGHSEKPDLDYSFKDHYRYFEAFMQEMALDEVTLVAHDWGTVVAWEYARNNPDEVVRLAFMEGVLPPTFPAKSFEVLGEELGGTFKAFKDPDLGHQLVIEQNVFVEKVLPRHVMRPLGEQAMQEYLSPYATEKSRKPLLEWPRQVPIAGEPAEMVSVLNGITEFMGTTEMPVLLLYASPGVAIPPSAVPWYVEKVQNIETSFVGAGLHFIQEDQPEAISRAVFDWMRRN